MKLEVGKNCAHVETDCEFAVFVDGAAYFEDLQHAFEQAERTIYIASWVIDPKMWLRADAASGDRLPLQTFLRRLVAKKPQLEIYVLIWDLAEAYRFSTNPWVIFQKGWLPHRRIRLLYDNHYPFGGCQHQKFVVIDDEVAYCGGIDLAVGRWDRPTHRVDDPHRIDAYGNTHQPFHDVQARVGGETAAYLGMQFRVRWRRVSVRRAHSPTRRASPISLPPGEPALVAISRTDPVPKPPIREIAAISLDLIADAKDCIYIENQYLTSRVLGDALANRLREPDGPEVIIIGPRQPSGWIEEITVGILRWRVVDALRNADKHGRLRIYYPMASLAADVDIYVHAKVMIIDDRIVRVGSANVSRRSLMLDLEMDVIAITTSKFALELRDRLVSEHLGISSEDMAESIKTQGSLRAALDELAGQNDRTLVPLGKGPAMTDREFAQDGDVFFDPAEPFEMATLAETLVGRHAGKRIVEIAPAGYATISIICAVVVLWRLCLFDATPWIEGASAWIDSNTFLAVVITVGIGSGLLSIGASIFIVMLPAVIVFGMAPGIAVTWVAGLVGAAVSYAFGKLFGRNAGSKLFGVRVQDVRQRLFGRGIFSVLTLRALPISSFAAVGFAAGAGDVNFRTFMLGTALGVIPDLLFLAIVAFWVASFVRAPNVASFLAMVLSVIFAGAVIRAAMRAIERRENRKLRNVPGRLDSLK